MLEQRSHQEGSLGGFGEGVREGREIGERERDRKREVVHVHVQVHEASLSINEVD